MNNNPPLSLAVKKCDSLMRNLIDLADPGWPIVQDWLAGATKPVDVLPANRPQADQTLLNLQVTTRSPMGAVVHNSSGILFDDGWRRVLGSGHPRLSRSLVSWNALLLARSSHRFPGALLITDDVIGGFFALNGDAFSSSPGQVQYFAPDTLNWEDTGKSYSEFLIWACLGDFELFYENARWPGWQSETTNLSGDKVISIYPFLFAEGPSIAERSRKAVAIEELWEMQMGTQLENP